ncbi:DUF6285 domain-containing protein [Pseudomonas sp. SMN5]|uniref:DUF6285 domain-containing protein n=1 Tax=Pseudomonas sp. SMN5 TaxID=3390198 RepID=UPI003F87484B
MTQPNAHELLEIARTTLLEQLLPALPGELRYPTLMIANAMAIAARESRLGPEAEGLEQERLTALVGAGPSTLPDLRRQLVHAIRQGCHDTPPTRRTLVETLHQITVARLAISNPKALP